MPARKRSAAIAHVHERFFEGKAERLAELEEARASAEVARKVYELRSQSGLTQRELAKRVRTTPSVISRLEDDDYRGHSLSMLHRVAAACGERVQIRFVTAKETQAA